MALLVCLASPAFAQEPRYLYPALIGVEAGDIDSTLKGLHQGAQESNLLTRAFCLGHAGPKCTTGVSVGKTAFLLLAAEGARKLGPERKRAAFVLVLAATALDAVVVGFNYAHLRGQR